MHRHLRLLHGFAAALLVASIAWAQDAAGTGNAAGPDEKQYLRVKDDRRGAVSLEVAVREFVPPEARGPRVALVSIAHIGEKQLYEEVQELLGAYDLVLYEAVTPPGVGRPTGETPEEKAASTEAALRLIASIAEAHRAKAGSYPQDEQGLRRAAKAIDGMVVNWLEAAMTDAWGNRVLYEALAEESGYRVVSFGRDGAPGGDGHDADIEVCHGDAIRPLHIERDNIQAQLARALGLSFQLAELDYAAPNWRHSDMNVSTLNEAFQERDLDFGLVGDAFGGATLPAQLARLLLGLIGMLDQMMEGAVSDLIKVAMIEILGDPVIVRVSMAHMGAGFGEVIIDLRNQVVIDDLRTIIRDEPEVASVAVLYGAAHMPDLAQRLREQLGYEPAEEEPRWITAMNVDISASRLSPAQIRQMRQMIRRTLHQQMRGAGRRSGE